MKEIIHRHYEHLSKAYAYYSVMGSGAEESMQLNEYTEFCHDIDIPDNASKYCKLKDIDGIFITAAFKSPEECKHLGLDKKSLGRHEFIEAFIRMSEAKFGHGQRPADVTDLPGAVDLCCREILIPNLPPDTVLDVNAFRTNHLYTAEMDQLLKANKPLLLGLFAMYRSRLRTRGLVVDGWTDLLENCKLQAEAIGPIGLNGRECKLAFLWSRMLKVDPHTVPKGWTQGAITFVEFIEAVARTADLVAFPADQDLRAGGFFDGKDVTAADQCVPLVSFLKACDAGTAPSDGPLAGRRPSGDLFTPATRPLTEKVTGLLEVMTHRLIDHMQAPNKAEFMKMLKKARSDAPK